MAANGSVVSKNDIVMRHAPFTQRGVSLAAREKNAQLEIHECGLETLGDWWNYRNVCTPFWRAYYNFEQGCSVRSGGRLYSLNPAQVILVPEAVSFDCIGQAGVDHLWLHFSLRSTLATGSGVRVIPVDRAICEMAGMLKSDLNKEGRPVDRIRHVCTGFLHLVFANMQSFDLTPVPPKLGLIYDYITTNLSRPMTNPELARQAGMSVEGFIRWFKKTADCTPAKYIAEQRIREACRRLAFTDVSIETLAEAVGFSDRHHFSRIFKRYAGCGPANFRSCRGKSGTAKLI